MPATTSQHLRRGDLLPRILTPPPGPRARELSRRLAEVEAPGINTLSGEVPNILWHEARGANVLDVDGNRYIDLTAGFGVAAVGHRHPRVVEALRRQSAKLVHGLGDAAAHEPRLELAARLRELVAIDDARTYFAVSGADAVEVALKTAILATGRPAILAFESAYHGLTLGALAVTSRSEFRRPFAPYLHPHVRRLPYGCDPQRFAAELDRDPRPGCVLVEPIAGREGILVPPAGWLRKLAAACRRRQVLLAVDEIFTGLGRTGRLFACEEEGVVPDLLCCGKALAGGLPIAAVVGHRELMAAWRRGGEALHTATFVAHPLACAAALATLEVLVDEDLPGRAARLGRELAERLDGWVGRYAAVVACCGRGLAWGVELVSAPVAAEFTARARRRGVLLLAGGPQGRIAQLVPPLTISERQLAAALALLENVLDEICHRLTMSIDS